MPHKYLLFFLPFVCWCLLFRDFLSGAIVANVDTLTHFMGYQYFLRNWEQGVVPLWEPYIYAGRPFLPLAMAGFYNPFLWIAAALGKLGLPLYHAYLLNWAVYFWFGAIGFYWLCRRFVGPGLYSYAGYLLILFSGIGVSIFNQVFIVLLFVPAVWFFVFLLAFIETKNRAAFLAMVFSLMVIVVSYNPFYFLTLLLITLVVSVLVAPAGARSAGKKILSFYRHYTGTILLALIAVVVALVPLMLYQLNSSTGDMISPARHNWEHKGPESTNPVYQRAQGVLNYADAGRRGTLGERVMFRYLFAHLDKWSYSSDVCFYLPVFAWILIAVSMYVFFDRKRFGIFIIFFVLLLTSLGESSPVYRFFFANVFFFQYFRNLFFFTAYLLPLAALFAVCQFKALAEYRSYDRRESREMLLFIVVAHAGIAAFFVWLGDVPSSSYWTILLSLFFFLLLGLLKEKPGRTYMPGLLLLMMLVQPTQLFNAYAKYSSDYSCPMVEGAEENRFQLTRPTEEKRPDCRVYRDWPRHGELWYLAAMQDSPAWVVGHPEQVGRWVYFLSRDLPQDIYRNYIRSKFMLFDAVGFLDDQQTGLAPIANDWAGQLNRAVIAREDQRLFMTLKDSPKRPAPAVITKEDTSFRVVSFGPNAIAVEMDSPAPVFLVYNDAFHTFWKAFVDGNKVPLHRANVAFKGVGVPQGKHRVEFRFDPLGGEMIYIFVFVFFWAFFVHVLIVAWKNQRQTRLSGGT